MARLRPASSSGRRANGRGARRERGSALVVVLLVIGALSYLSVMGARSARTELQVAEKDVQAKQALSVAEAGVNHAYNLIKSSSGFTNELSSGGTGGTLTNLGSVVALDGQNYRFLAFGGGSSDGYYVRAVDDYDETSGANDPTIDKNNRIYLVSRGRVGSAERVVTAAVGGVSKFPYALFGDRFITLSGGSQTDSFDSRVGPYNALTAGSKGSVRSNDSSNSIDLSGGSTAVHGDAIAHGTVTTSGGATVTGTSTDGAPTMSFPAVPDCYVANGNHYSSASGITGGSYNPSTGVLNASGGGAISLANGTYCFHTITLSGGSTLSVSGPVTLDVNGAVNISGGSVVNTTNLASNLQLYSSLNDPTNNNGVVLSGGSATYMVVDAPTTGLTFSGGLSTFYGAVVAAAITNSGGVHVHYDEALFGILSSVAVSSWQEVRN